MAIEIEEIRIGKAHAEIETHFSGGLRGLQVVGGFALLPLAGEAALLFRAPQDLLRFATEECGVRYIGTCVKYMTGENAPIMHVWEHGQRDQKNGLDAAASWAAIAQSAELAGDSEYANCARYISVCLHVSWLRLRDISDRYFQQLKWALAENSKSEVWFSNIALLELSGDFHSLASELSSARDHLSRIAAIHAGASDSVDSLTRLDGWVRKKAGRPIVNQPMIDALLSAAGTDDFPGWLRRLGHIRNEMLHSVPMGANRSVSALALQDVKTSLGDIQIIRLGEPSSESVFANKRQDPLMEFSDLSLRLEDLCRVARRLAKYPAELMVLKGKSI